LLHLFYICYIYYITYIDIVNICYISYTDKKELIRMDKKTSNKVLLSLPDNLLKKIEDFQFEHRISNRSEAIRILIEKGLGK